MQTWPCSTRVSGTAVWDPFRAWDTTDSSWRTIARWRGCLRLSFTSCPKLLTGATWHFTLKPMINVCLRSQGKQSLRQKKTFHSVSCHALIALCLAVETYRRTITTDERHSPVSKKNRQRNQTDLEPAALWTPRKTVRIWTFILSMGLALVQDLGRRH
jgi:hypothetical protein